MTSLADLARSCGYTVLVEASPTCLEITGNGHWHAFQRECLRYVKCAPASVRHAVRDHVTIIFRDPLGGRELHDLGKMGERKATLPSCSRKPKRAEYLLGVRPSGSKWIARVMPGGRKQLYLGTFDDPIAAGMARDRYVVEHGMRVALNFPDIRELMKRTFVVEGTD